MQSNRKMYTIKQGNKTFSLTHSGHHYVVGFQNIRMARKVQLNLHPEPLVQLRREQTHTIEIMNDCISIDIDSLITMQKFKGSSEDPLNDAGYFISTHPERDFLSYPIDNMVGIVMPYELIKEDEDSLTFRTHVVDPFFNADYFKSSLKKLL